MELVGSWGSPAAPGAACPAEPVLLSPPGPASPRHWHSLHTLLLPPLLYGSDLPTSQAPHHGIEFTGGWIYD